MKDTRYKTFWRRLGAGIIDGLVLSPALLLVGLPLMAFAIVNESGAIYLLAVGVMYTIPLGYSVTLHSRGGQTVGKMATGVIVVDSRTHGPITLSHALKRDSGQIVLAVTGFVVLAMNLPDLGNLEEDGSGGSLVDMQQWASSLWFLAEMVSIWTNGRRRAIHDLIAGTVVVKRSALEQSTDASNTSAGKPPAYADGKPTGW